jgi:hypothetical protein
MRLELAAAAISVAEERGGCEDRNQMHGKLQHGAYRLNAGERRPGSGNSRA